MENNISIRVPVSEWKIFKETDLGETILRQLEGISKDIKEYISMGGCFEKGSTDNTAINYALNTGMLQGINCLLYPELIKEGDENES